MRELDLVLARSWMEPKRDEQRENLDLGLKLDKPYNALTKVAS